MARIDIAEDGRIESRAFYTTYPALGASAEALLVAVYSEANPLPPLVREAVRYRIARANECLVCGSARLIQGLSEEFYERMTEWRDVPELYDAQTRAALDFAERFATDHLSIDDPQFASLQEHFTQAQIAALGISCAYFSAFGRLTRVLMLDHACSVELAA